MVSSKPWRLRVDDRRLRRIHDRWWAYITTVADRPVADRPAAKRPPAATAGAGRRRRTRGSRPIPNRRPQPAPQHGPARAPPYQPPPRQPPFHPPPCHPPPPPTAMPPYRRRRSNGRRLRRRSSGRRHRSVASRRRHRPRRHVPATGQRRHRPERKSERRHRGRAKQNQMVRLRFMTPAPCPDASTDVAMEQRNYQGRGRQVRNFLRADQYIGMQCPPNRGNRHTSVGVAAPI